MNVSMNFIYVPMAWLISLTRMNSSFLCEREESPGPIFIASQCTLIQSDVVGEENVSSPRALAHPARGEFAAVADDLFRRLRGVRVLRHSIASHHPI